MQDNELGEYHHVFNRGMQKQPIFTKNADQYRFLFLLLTLQGSFTVPNINRILKSSVERSILKIDLYLVEEILKDRQVELVSFCLMPNHFHLIVRELHEGGISKYMQRLQNAYTKYFNTKYNKSGHLFQSSYKSKVILDDLYLMHLSAYIHKNPKEFSDKVGREDSYYWSSYQDCVLNNRFPNLLAPEVLLKKEENFNYKESYREFVRTSLAKENAVIEPFI